MESRGGLVEMGSTREGKGNMCPLPDKGEQMKVGGSGLDKGKQGKQAAMN